MPSIFKASLIFGFSPDRGVQNGVVVPGRVGGFSENYWFSQTLTLDNLANLASKRIALCCPDIRIIGWRLTPYTYAGNKLTPGKANVGSFLYEGKFTGDTNSPSDALRLRALAGGVPVTWTMFLHAIPDDIIESAQYLQQNQFQAAFGLFRQWLLGQNAGLPAAYWLGRDPTQPSQRVLSIDGTLKKLTTQATLGVVANADYVRLRRVYDDANMPIKGTFYCASVVANVDGSFTYGLPGLPPRSRTTPSGTARKDLILASPLTDLKPVLLSSRKIGRPTSLYRGRRTKQRA